MPRLNDSLALYRYRVLPIIMLVFSTLASLALLTGRRLVTGRYHYSWLVWDLFLAWIPLWIAMALHVLHTRGTLTRKRMLLLGIAWLLFFPNAPYLLTEFVHLSRRHDGP